MPKAIPIRLLMNRKLAEAVARMVGWTICWTAEMTGPEYRLVVDLGDLDATTTVLTTGLSGLPGSPHYTDMVDPWVHGASLPLPHGPAAVEAAKVAETRLEP